MSGSISKMTSVYLNKSDFEQAIKDAKGTIKYNHSYSGYHTYQVEVSSSTLRKVGFVVGMVLTGFIPFIVLNLLSRSFHEYFFKAREVVHVVTDPLQAFSSTMTTLKVALKTINPGRRSVIEKWQDSPAAQQYRSDLKAGDRVAIEKALRERQAKEKEDEPPNVVHTLGDYVYVTGPSSSTSSSDTITFNLYYTQVAIDTGNIHTLTVSLDGEGRYLAKKISLASREQGSVSASAKTLEDLVSSFPTFETSGAKFRLC